MSDDATYTFYPVVRAGHRPGSEFDGSEGSIPDSGETTVALSVTGYDDDDRETTEEAAVAVHVYGPGDVTGLDERQIVRREPTPRTDAFPPRQFPVVEFDRPDLPWLFSPQRADVAGRVHPWLCLVVVDRDHPDVSYAAVGPGSLPALEAPVSELPDPAESYLWAHAQHLGTPGDGADVPAIAAESTHSRSRLLCPRNLEANTRYRAAVVPVFEPGRQAGLGRDPDPTNAFAWDAESGTVELPVYDSWTFATSPEGDFVSLATDLEPVVLGQDIGRRTVDVSKPGPTALKRPGEQAESTVGLEGALESPAAAALSDPYDPDLADRLRSLLNRSESLDEALPEDVVAPPLYGQWHASRSVVGASDADWFDQLNGDPRYRMAAGFGTTVVQAEQEHLMAAAWEQFGDLREANGYLCRSQLVRESLRTTYDRIRTKSPGRLLQLSGPIHRHVFDDRLEGTVHSHVVGTTTPVGMTNPKFRGLTNSHGPLARRDGATLEATAIATRIEEGLVPGQTLDAESKAVGSETDTVTDHDGVHELDPEAGVGAEFGGVDTSLGQDLATGPVGWSAPSFGDVGATGAGSPGGANMLAVTAGSEGPQLPPGVRSADPDADPADERYESRVARHRVLALCESVERHCLSARSVLSRLERAVDREEHAQVVDLVRADPDPYRRAASIVPNAVEPLSRALSKLLIEPRPPTVAAELTSDVAADQCDRLRESGDQLEAAVEAALEAALEGLSDPEAPLDAASPPLSSATTTISRMIGVVDRIRSMVAIEADADPTMAGAEGPTDADGMGAGFSTSMLKSQQFGPAPGAELAQADLEAVTDAILTELDPDRGLPAVVADRLNLPAIPDRLDPLEQIMAAPSFDRPMSESLVDLDPEHLLPGVGEVPDDSVGLVQTNPAFVEAFMAGLNHEMARLLRWRRYPTDKRGTYFRQFWDHRASPDVDALEDIEELHRWSGALGSNDLEGDDEPTAVLLVRGELLRRYPNTMIYAAKATEDATGEIGDSDRIPALPNLYENVEEGDALDDENVRFPQFSGSLGDDVTFFGFDLTVPEARADPYHLVEKPAPDDHDDEGWFFVIEEPPADVRFGMLGGDDDESIDPIAETGEYVAVANEPDWYDGMSDDDGSGVNQSVEWGKNSAHMAHITWRRPSRVAIHASELLPDPDDDDPFVIGEMPETFELADDLSFLTSPGSTSTDGGVDE